MPDGEVSMMRNTMRARSAGNGALGGVQLQPFGAVTQRAEFNLRRTRARPLGMLGARAGEGCSRARRIRRAAERGRDACMAAVAANKWLRPAL